MKEISFARIMDEIDYQWEERLLQEPLTAGSLWEIYQEWKNRATVRSLPIPWPGFRQKFGGLRLGEVTLISGDSGHGKTTLALNIFFHLARFCDDGGMVFSLEMGEGAVAKKLFQMKTGVLPGTKNQRAEEEFKIWSEATCMYVLRHKGHLPFKKLKMAIAWATLYKHCPAILVDHFHSVVPAKCEAYDIELMMQELTSLAEKLKVALVVICHPAKLRGDSKERRVEMDDLKGSSGLKQYADNVLSVFWDKANSETKLALHKIRDQEFGHNSGAEITLKLNPSNQTYQEVVDVR